MLKICLFIFSTVGTSLGYYIFNRPLGIAHIVETPLDNFLPIVPILTIPYLIFIPYVWGLIIYAFIEKKQFLALSIASIMIYVTSFVVYLTYQTYVPAPEIPGNDIFSKILRLVYEFDQRFSDLPSLHASMATLTAIYFWFNHSKYRYIALLYSIIVIASTVLLKQHYIPGMISGVLLGLAIGIISFVKIKDNG